MTTLAFDPNRLKSLRAARGETLRQVAEATGVSNPLVSQIENGRVENPGILTVARLARHFEVSVDSFLVARKAGVGS
jgi:transcriptional regulator with XRE-family HTH domain